MGNNQSNTRTPNYKKFKILAKNGWTESGENWLFGWKKDLVDFYLDESINYRDGSNIKITFNANVYVEGGFVDKFFNETNVGNYLELNLDKLKEQKENYQFCIIDGVLRGVERRDSNGNLLESTGEFLKEYNEANQRHAYMAETARYQNQVLQSQTSWNMPPKW